MTPPSAAGRWAKRCPIRGTTEAKTLHAWEVRLAALAQRAAPLLTVRHNAVAHINAWLSEKDVFAPLNITWNEIRSVINDSASFVAELAGVSYPGEVGIPREGRLSEATLRMLASLARNGA